MTRKLILVTVATLLLVSGNTFAYNKSGSKHNKHAAVLPIVYLGIGTGITSPVGYAGISADFPMLTKFSIATGMGMSTWGAKGNVEARYYTKDCSKGWAFGVGISMNTGKKNVLFKKQSTTAGNDQDINVNENTATNLLFIAHRFFPVGSRSQNRLELQLGWAAKLGNNTVTQLNGDPLTDNALSTIKVFAPGNMLIIGVGYSFGLGKK